MTGVIAIVEMVACIHFWILLRLDFEPKLQGSRRPNDDLEQDMCLPFTKLNVFGNSVSQGIRSIFRFTWALMLAVCLFKFLGVCLCIYMCIYYSCLYLFAIVLKSLFIFACAHARACVYLV